MRTPLLILAVLALSHAALLTTTALSKHFRLSPESSRKLLHTLLGLLLCPLPWLFHTAPPVIALCLTYVALLLSTRHCNYLAKRVCPVIHAVPRRSAGDLFFPLAVALLFLTTRHDKPAYLAAMLTLTFADTAAALVGQRYGQSPYTTPTGATKTLEGSAAFATVAFAGTHLPLLLIGDTTRAQSVLIALTVAIVLTLAEALSFAGLDNLLVPLLAVALMHFTRPVPPEHLGILCMLTLLGAAALLARHTATARRTPAPT